MARSKREVPAGFVTLQQAAQALDCSVATVRNMVEAEKFSHKRLGGERGAYIIPIEEVQKEAAKRAEKLAEKEKEEERVKPDDVMKILEDLGGETSVVALYRKNKGKYAYIDEFEPEAFNLAAIKEEYGGGDFQARFKDSKGEYITSKNFRVEGLRKPDTLESNIVDHDGTPRGGDLIVELIRGMREDLRQNRGDPMELAVQMVTAMTGMMSATMGQVQQMLPNSSAPSPTSFKEMFEVLQTGIELGQTMSGKGESGDPTIAMMGEIASFLKSKREQPETEQKALPPATETPPVDPNVPGWVSLIRNYMSMLMNLAQGGKNPALYAQVLLDQMPDSALPIIGEQAERLEDFKREFFIHFPEAGNFKWWFEELMDELAANIVREDIDGTEAAEVHEGGA